MLVSESNTNHGGQSLELSIQECPSRLREMVFGTAADPSEVIPWMVRHRS